MTTIKDLLADARPAERSVPVCLRGDLYADLEELDRQLRTLQSSPRESLADGEGQHELARQIEDLREAMREATRDFRLRSLGRKGWQELRAAHPPRSGDEKDELHSVNVETFYPALVRASVVEPPLDDADWARLEICLSDQQWEDLVAAAVVLNRQSVSVPFSSAASEILQTSASE
jgi:hypothetical protein